MKTKHLLIYSFFAGILGACSVQDNDQRQADTADLGLEEVQYDRATTADTVLATDDMVARHFVRVPDSPQGYRIAALLEVLKAENDEQILPFVYDHYAQDFIMQVPQDKHKSLLESLQQEIQHAELESLEKLEDAYRIELRNRQGIEAYVIDVYFEPDAPYKISGVRVL